MLLAAPVLLVVAEETIVLGLLDLSAFIQEKLRINKDCLFSTEPISDNPDLLPSVSSLSDSGMLF